MRKKSFADVARIFQLKTKITLLTTANNVWYEDWLLFKVYLGVVFVKEKNNRLVNNIKVDPEPSGFILSR